MNLFLLLFACLELDYVYADGRLVSLTEGRSPRNFSTYPSSLGVKTDIVFFEESQCGEKDQSLWSRRKGAC